MKAKLNRSNVSHFFCQRVSDWYVIWLNFRDDFFGELCFIDNFKLVYKNDTNSMVDQEGVDIRINGEFGSPSPCACLDPSHSYISNYFGSVIKELHIKFNYIGGKDLFCASYDFRKVGDTRSINVFYEQLKNLIEKQYETTNAPVMLISHSMGSPLVAKFLSTRTTEWKNKYVDSWFSISGALGGSFYAVYSHLFGYTFGLPEFLLPKQNLKMLQNSYPSTYFLFPDKELGDPDQVVVWSTDKVFTLGNISKIIPETNDHIGKMLEHIGTPFVKQAPGIPMACVYTLGHQTVSKIRFLGEFMKSKFVLEYTDGDITVPISSLQICKKWASTNPHPVELIEIPGHTHISILRSPDLTEKLNSYLLTRIHALSHRKKVVDLGY